MDAKRLLLALQATQQWSDYRLPRGGAYADMEWLGKGRKPTEAELEAAYAPIEAKTLAEEAAALERERAMAPERLRADLDRALARIAELERAE